jgi:hypothetical protein
MAVMLQRTLWMYDSSVDVYCENEEADECLHVSSTLALPELRQLIHKRTMKKLDQSRNYTRMKGNEDE